MTRRPGFDRDAPIRMAPGVTVFVRDAYVAGEGMLHAAVLGLVTVADLRGTEAVAEGELYRFLAEAAWYPTALLPSQGAEWSTVDARRADVTLRDGAVSATLRLTFGDDGMIEMVRAECTARDIGARPRATVLVGARAAGPARPSARAGTHMLLQGGDERRHERRRR